MAGFCYTEQFEILNKIIQNQDKIEKPILTEDTLDSINYIFQVKVKMMNYVP